MDLCANHVQLHLPEFEDSTVGEALCRPLKKRVGSCKVIRSYGFAEVCFPQLHQAVKNRSRCRHVSFQPKAVGSALRQQSLWLLWREDSLTGIQPRAFWPFRGQKPPLPSFIQML